jgi:hypothetical protein
MDAMKKIVFITQYFLLLISVFNAKTFSQNIKLNKKIDYEINKFKTVEIRIPIGQSFPKLNHIRSFKVVDARADTSAIGLLQKRTNKPIFILLHDGVKNQTGEFLGNYVKTVKNDSNGLVVMVLKKFWLTDELDLSNEKYQGNILDLKEESVDGSILVSIEFYFNEQDNYYPLYRFDTTLTRPASVAIYGPDLVGQALILSLEKLLKLDEQPISAAASRRKLNWEEIKKYNEEKFDIPILKDTPFVTGVYTSFEEFKKNNPTERNFQISKDGLADIIYIKQPDGKEIASRNFWGFCDGKNAFIKSRDKYFLLQRQGNAFYIYGSKKFVKPRSMAPGPLIYQNGLFVPSYGMAREEKTKLELRPFQLDWDTGKLN